MSWLSRNLKTLQSVICSLEEYKDTATPLQGAGKLTEKAINLMQNCYGK